MSKQNQTFPDNPQIQVVKSGKTGLFTNYIFKAIPLAFDESMSYYETLCGLLNYLQNTIIPTVNNNADAVAELQSLYEQLRSYVDNYFTNLDVQEEINNKLDQMVADGTLPEIVASYLNSKAVFGYDTVASMKQATNLIDGSYANTLGYHTKNDGGKSLYKIRTKTSNDIINEMTIIKITDNLVAELIEKDSINIMQLGAYGDNLHDDSTILQFAIDNFKKIIIPNNTFLISNNINITKQCTITGLNKGNSILHLSNNASILCNTSYITINNIGLLLSNNYNETAIKLLTPSNVVSRIINNINIIGDNHSGNGIGIYGTDNHGTMGDVISDVTFNKLNAGIIADITSGWNSAEKIENCWCWSCVYGMYWTDNSGKTNNLYISNFKGQYNANITKALIYNLRGNGCTVDNCFIWDGGFTLIIDKQSNYTTVRAISVTNKAKYKDLGFRTRVENININTEYGRFYDYEDNFFGNALNKYTVVKSENSNVTNEMVTPSTGLTRPAIKLTTGETTGDYALFKLGTLCLNETAMWTLDFDLYIQNLTNVQIYVGGDFANSTNPQGNFISLDTSVNNNLRAVDKGSPQIISDIDLINGTDLLNNKWYHCQIKYISETQCLFYIDGEYIGEIDSHRYNQQPYFYIKTLENIAKTMAIANLHFNNYIY